VAPGPDTMASPPHLAQTSMMRTVQPMSAMTLPHHRSTLTSGPKDSSTTTLTAAGTDGGMVTVSSVPATPRRTGSGMLTYPTTPSARRERMPSPETGYLRARPGTGQSSAALLAPAAVAIAASSPALNGHRAASDTGSNSARVDSTLSHKGSRPPSLINSSASSTALLAGSSLGALISKVATTMAEREQEIRKHQSEQREVEDLLAKSKNELQQLISVVSQLHELQQSASEVLPDVVAVGPERPRAGGQPPFFWQPSAEYAEEFDVSGEWGEIVTKTKDFEDQGWVIPVGGSWRLTRGGLYRWSLKIERKCPSRPQLQLGIHGQNHTQPWRLVTTSRCSWSRDDEPWQDRPGGDRLIDEGDYVHIEVDLRGINAKQGTFSLAINDEQYEQFFDDIPLNASYPLMPVVSMGGDQSRVRLCSTN